MAAPKKSTAKKPTRKNPADDERKRSAFAEIGRAAAKEAQRKALLGALKSNGWNLTAAGETLEMGAGAAAGTAVIRALKELAPDEYENARNDGRISQGNRREE